MRFVGTIEAKVDSKGRVFLPAVFRKAFPQTEDGYNLVMRKDLHEDCLVLYNEQTWNRRLDELNAKLSIWSKGLHDIKRRFCADVQLLTLDSNGRILLPKRYLAMAGIESEVTFIGIDDTIEIWATSKLQEHQNAADFAAALEQIMTEQ